MNDTTTQTHGMKAAKCTQADIDLLRAFFQELDEKVEQYHASALGYLMQGSWAKIAGAHWQRLIFGYETLVENACDPNLDYLEFKPEILNLEAELENEKKANLEISRLNLNMQVELQDLHLLLFRINEHSKRLPISVESDIRRALERLSRSNDDHASRES